MDICKNNYSAEFYDILNILHWEITQNTISDILPLLNEDGVFLDIGAGTGNLSLFLATKLRNSKIIAIEPSIDMRIAFISKILSSNNYRKRITIIPSKISDYNIDETFDACFMVDVIGHLSRYERRKIWEKLSFHLKKDGFLLITNLPKEFNDWKIGPIGQSYMGDNTIISYIVDKQTDDENSIIIDFKIDVINKRGIEIYSYDYRIEWKIIDSQILIEELKKHNFTVLKKIGNGFIFIKDK